jgi:Family of unknown function (DUF5681)
MGKSSKSGKSRKRSTVGEFAPVVRALAKKKGPRGKPFRKGNPIGLETRFSKGAPSANPGGRPRVAKLNQAIREGLAADSDKSLPMNTNAQVLAAQVIRQAKAGNLNAINVAGDRAEGRPNVSISLDDSRDRLEILIDSMKERSRIVGPAEDNSSDDYSTPLLQEEN